jgi:hypothetical protein
MKRTLHLEPRTVALLLGGSIGLGLAVHEVFFLVAVGVVSLAAAEALQGNWKVTHAHP